MPMVLAGLHLHDIPDAHVMLLRLRGHDAVAHRDHQNLVATVAVPARLRSLLEIHHAGVEEIAFTLGNDGLTGAMHLSTGPPGHRLSRTQRHVSTLAIRTTRIVYASSCMGSGPDVVSA